MATRDAMDSSAQPADAAGAIQINLAGALQPGRRGATDPLPVAAGPRDAQFHPLLGAKFHPLLGASFQLWLAAVIAVMENS